MTRVYLDAVGLFGTGLASWAQSLQVLRGEQPYMADALPLPAPEWLPPAERRRTSDIIRLALCAGREALTIAEQDIANTYTVFTSSGGSGEVIHQICESLATAERDVSPTRFHNSVHNAPAGYWGIATRSEWPSTSLCAHDASFAAGLVEAVAQAHTAPQPVLLLAHDLRYPEPLNGVRAVEGMFSVAMLLGSVRSARSTYALDVHLSNVPQQGVTADRMADAALERLRANNPAARVLPLLAAVARGAAQRVVIENVNGTSVTVDAAPL
jgi:Beta-ketoacyl synthase, N-terminal domain